MVYYRYDLILLLLRIWLNIFKFFLIDHLSSNVKKIGVKKNNLRSVYTHLLHNKKKKKRVLLLLGDRKEVKEYTSILCEFWKNGPKYLVDFVS